jgi:hypothetical protein
VCDCTTMYRALGPKLDESPRPERSSAGRQNERTPVADNAVGPTPAVAGVPVVAAAPAVAPPGAANVAAADGAPPAPATPPLSPVPPAWPPPTTWLIRLAAEPEPAAPGPWPASPSSPPPRHASPGRPLAAASTPSAASAKRASAPRASAPRRAPRCGRRARASHSCSSDTATRVYSTAIVAAGSTS